MGVSFPYRGWYSRAAASVRPVTDTSSGPVRSWSTPTNVAPHSQAATNATRYSGELGSWQTSRSLSFTPSPR